MFPKIVLTVDNEIYGMAGSSKVEDGRDNDASSS